MMLSSELVQIFIMNFDDVKGIIPLLIFPDESIKDNEDIMRPIKFHPIWFLDLKDQKDFEHTDLRYKERVYLAKKFDVCLKKYKNRGKSKEKILDTVVLIIVLPKEMDFYGFNFLNIIYETIIEDFKDFFHKIIESEFLKENLIKSPKTIEIIKKGDFLKEEIKKSIINICENYFSTPRSYYQKNRIKVD